MNRTTRAAAVAAALCLSAAPSQAQNIQWVQTTNLPKGLNMPQGVSADVLGIQLGDTYEEAKRKALAIFNDDPTKEPRKQFGESKRIFRLQQPGVGNTIELQYVGLIRMEMRRYDKPELGNETIEIVLSAPSSGHQVLGVKRYLSWSNQGHQPRVSELLQSLEAKFKTRAWVFNYPRGGKVARFQFNDGQAIIPPGADLNSCPPQGLSTWEQANLKNVNPSGTCDVVLQVDFASGISPDHTSQIVFWLADNERAKKNLGADYAFFGSYIRGLRQNTGGTRSPKL